MDSAISTYDEALRSLKDNLNLLNRSLKDIDNNGWKGKFKKQFMSIKYGELYDLENYYYNKGEIVQELEYIQRKISKDIESTEEK